VALSTGSKWFLAFLALVLAGVAGGLYALDDVLGPEVAPGRPVSLVVEPGESVRSVSDRLREEGVVRSATTFRLEAEEEELSTYLQPGEYELETGMSNEEAIAVLLAGPLGPVSVRFTIPEGLPLEVILERLAETFEAHEVADFRAVLDERAEAGANVDGVLQLPSWVPEPGDAEEGIEPFEGLFFPETYEVEPDASPRRILQRMVDQLELVMGRVPDEGVEAARVRGLTRYEVLIVASIVEREVVVPAERETVARVILNRLLEGMRLQVDATVLYAKGEHAEMVATEDLEIDSPYNTYVVEGLPPTPISAPGEASLSAAFAPADVTHRFYVLDAECDGSHVFADTLEEHEANVAAFREADRCR